MTIFDLLKADHKKVQNILKQLDRTEESDSEEREQMFTTLKTELMPHLRAEEAIMYPRIRQTEEMHQMALEAIEEHSVVEYLLGQIDELDCSDEIWGAKLTVMKENIEHHVEEEEREIFKAMRDFYSRGELSQLGDEIREFKQSFLGVGGQRRQPRQLRQAQSKAKQRSRRAA